MNFPRHDSEPVWLDAHEVQSDSRRWKRLTREEAAHLSRQARIAVVTFRVGSESALWLHALDPANRARLFGFGQARFFQFLGKKAERKDFSYVAGASQAAEPEVWEPMAYYDALGNLTPISSPDGIYKQPPTKPAAQNDDADTGFKIHLLNGRGDPLLHAQYQLNLPDGTQTQGVSGQDPIVLPASFQTGELELVLAGFDASGKA